MFIKVKKYLLSILLCLNSSNVFSNNCIISKKNKYGSEKTRKKIEQSLITNLKEVPNLISAGFLDKGNDLGCPELAISYKQFNSKPVTQKVINNHIDSFFRDASKPISLTCPQLGRKWAALYSSFNILSNQLIEKNKNNIELLINHYIDLQNKKNGVFGIQVQIQQKDSCYRNDIAHKSARHYYQSNKNFSTKYQMGQFKDQIFITENISGGLFYDHAWIMQFLKSYLHSKFDNKTLKAKAKASFLLASHWAYNQSPSINSNYTAKQIWSLSLAYSVTKDEKYLKKINDILEYLIYPSIIDDQDNDGFVDRTDNKIKLSSLNRNAQVLGRFWDSHNALQWYHAINLNALLEVLKIANKTIIDIRKLKHTIEIVAQNLINEINNVGIPDQFHLGFQDTTYAIFNLNSNKKSLNLINLKDATYRLLNSSYFNKKGFHFGSLILLYNSL